MARLNTNNKYMKKYIFSLLEKLIIHFYLEYQISKENKYSNIYAFHKNNFFKSFIITSKVYEGYSN